MCKAKKFNNLSLQICVFTPFLSFNTNKIFSELMKKNSEVFDGDTISLPVSLNIPKDIPRLTLYSNDKILKLEIAESRVNFLKRVLPGEGSEGKNKFIGLCHEVLKSYIECTSAKVGRLANVTIKYWETENPALLLAKHFCKDKFIEEPFNRPKSFEIHSHKQYKTDNFEINSWVRCKTGNLEKGNEPIIIVEQDINTLSEHTNEMEFDINKIDTFVQMAYKEQEEVLIKYFPNSL